MQLRMGVTIGAIRAGTSVQRIPADRIIVNRIRDRIGLRGQPFFRTPTRKGSAATDVIHDIDEEQSEYDCKPGENLFRASHLNELNDFIGETNIIRKQLVKLVFVQL
jgi:hypothetical protein